MIEMTYEFEYLLHLLGCAVLEKKAHPPKENLSWDKLFSLAKAQTVYPMILYLLKKQPELIGFDRKDWIKRETRLYLVSEEMKREASFELIKGLEDEGLTPVVLKGFSLSELYPEPAMRQSADLDLYVGVEQEKKAQNILKSYGVSVKKRDKNAQEAVCYYAPVGHIELHAWLLGKEDREAWMSDNPIGITQPYKTVLSNSKCTIYSLADRDNLFFLTIHFIKHLVKYGANLRNLLDVALFYRDCALRDDTNWFWAKMRKLHFENAVRTMFSCCVYFMDFSEKDFSDVELVNRDIADAFSYDLELGGWMGSNEKSERNYVRMIYDKALYDKEHKGGNWSYIWARRSRIIRFLGSMFCSKEHLYIKYSYAKKSRIWLIVGYLHRAVDGFLNFAKGNIKPIALDTNNMNSESQVIQRRIDYLKKIGLM